MSFSVREMVSKNLKQEYQVLVLEDNSADFDLLIELVSQATKPGSLYEQFKVGAAHLESLSAAKAFFSDLEEASAPLPDLLLLDLHLLDSDGMETLESVLEMDLNLPIVVLTGDINPDLWVEALHIGAEDYLVKGQTNPEMLMRVITHAVERYSLKRSLKEKLSEMENFAYVASHDLQEPLRKITAFGDRLQSVCAEELPDKGKDYLGRMINSSSRMQRLLDDLLSFSRISANTFEFSEIKISELVDQVLSDLELAINEAGAKIINQVEDFSIEADPIHLARLLQNLIANSIKYRDKNRAVEIKIEAKKLSDSQIKISVHDNGTGFDEAYKDKIFQQFQRLHGRSEYEGSGMGLASVKKIAEMHQGSITASSEIGKGSSFFLQLPIKQPIQIV